MAIPYVKYLNQNSSSSVYGQAFLRAVQTETLDLAALANHISQHNSVFSEGTILGVLIDMARCIRENMINGAAIKIDDVCILRLGFSCNGAATPEEATPKNITGLNVNAMGTGRMSVKTLINEVSFKELKKYSGVVSESETEENPGGDEPGGGESGGESGGDENGGSEEGQYTLTFKDASGNVVETQHYNEGDTVTAPTAPTGYVWTDCPTTMPARDLVVTAVEEGGDSGEI